MSFPPHINQVLDAYGVRADTKAALYELYVLMGDAVLEAFSDIADTVPSPDVLTPEDTLTIRHTVVDHYLRTNHPLWREGKPTPSLWRPRALEGRASGFAMPLADIHPPEDLIGDDQPVPDGIVMFGRNAHSGGRYDTLSFDVVAASLDDAIAIATSEGRQHTLPGSVGATSGTIDPLRSIALIWEIQPNVYKPRGDRNRAIAKIYRKHRNWHVMTFIAAMRWMREQQLRVYVLRGAALPATHEVNAAEPISPAIMEFHDRTVENVTKSLGIELADPSRDDETLLTGSDVMNTGLAQHVARTDLRDVLWRLIE